MLLARQQHRRLFECAGAKYWDNCEDNVLRAVISLKFALSVGALTNVEVGRMLGRISKRPARAKRPHKVHVKYGLGQGGHFSSPISMALSEAEILTRA